MSQYTSHLITSQPTTKPLTTLLQHLHITSQSQSTIPSHQCTMRTKTHMLNHTMSQYMLSQYKYTMNMLIHATLTHNLTMSLPYTTLHIIPLSMEKHPTAHLATITNQSETTNMSSHTDQKRRTSLLFSTMVSTKIAVYLSRYKSIIMLMRLATLAVMTTKS